MFFLCVNAPTLDETGIMKRFMPNASTNGKPERVRSGILIAPPISNSQFIMPDVKPVDKSVKSFVKVAGNDTTFFEIFP